LIFFKTPKNRFSSLTYYF